MKVRATAKGYYGEVRRSVGDVFEIKEPEFSSIWMERADDHERVRSDRDARIGPGLVVGITEEEAQRQAQPRAKQVNPSAYDPLEVMHTGKEIL